MCFFENVSGDFGLNLTISLQFIATGAGKAAKFVAANPLGPMANPFEGMDDDEKEYQKVCV